MRCANSALMAKVDGCVAVIHGILSTAFVSHCRSVFHAPFTPQIVFASGSLPEFTFVVNGRSRMCMSVPPIIRSLLNAYSRCTPNRLFLCIENSD